MRKLTICTVVAVVACLWSLPTIDAATEDVLRLALPGEGHLSSAEIAEDGLTLLAWESTENHWSKIQVSQAGTLLHEWEFPDLLIKGARWGTAGKRFLVFAVSEAGPVEHVYSISKDGQRHLEWSSQALLERFENVSFSALGDHWVATSFSVEEAHVAFGRVGEDTPAWEWSLEAGEYGRPTQHQVEEFSYVVTSGEDVEGAPDLGILWGTRLWLGRPLARHLVRVEPPSGCPQIRGVTATTDGLWIDCYRGIDAKFSHSWAYYSSGYSSDAEEINPTLVKQFRDPRFLPDGTVLDMYSRDGFMAVYELGEGATEIKPLGTLDVPSYTRILDAGDSLLVEVGELTDEFRVLPLKQEVTRLKEDAARANQ